MATRVEDCLARSYSTEIVPDEYTDGGMTYRASHPELPGCMAHGDTPGEARLNLDGARDLYIRTLLARGIEPPLPCASKLDVVWVSLNVTRPSLALKVPVSYQAATTGNVQRQTQQEAANQTVTSDTWIRTQ